MSRSFAAVCAGLVVVVVGTGVASARPDTRIAAARRADPALFAIFPTRFATTRCRIGYGGPAGGVMAGVCTTALARPTSGPDFSGQTVIAFTERWHWPPTVRGTARAFRHTWLVTLGPSRKVFGVRSRGAVPPQRWR